MQVGLPRHHSGKEPTCQCRRHKRCGFDPWVRKMPWGGNGNPLQYACPGNPRTEEPGGSQSMESQRVGHDWATEKNTQMCAHTHTHKQFRSFKLYQEICNSQLHWPNTSILSATKCHSRFRYNANSKKHAFWGPSNSDSWMIICARICIWIHRPISVLSLSSWTVSFTKLLFYHLKTACFRKMRNSTNSFIVFVLLLSTCCNHILKDKFLTRRHTETTS